MPHHVGGHKKDSENTTKIKCINIYKILMFLKVLKTGFLCKHVLVFMEQMNKSKFLKANSLNNKNYSIGVRLKIEGLQ